MPTIDIRLWKKPEEHPILFEECFKKKNFKAPFKERDVTNEDLGLPNLYEDYYRGVHLFVLVHGFQGTNQDMKMFKNQISLIFPEGVFLLSKSNEKQTDGDIEQMGQNLATEVKEFVEMYCPS